MNVPSPLSSVALGADGGEARTLRAYWQPTPVALLAGSAEALRSPGSFVLVVAETSTLFAKSAPSGVLSAVAYMRTRDGIIPVALPHLEKLPYESRLGSGVGDPQAPSIIVSRVNFRALDRVVSQFLPQLQRVFECVCADPRYVDRDVQDLLASPVLPDISPTMLLPAAGAASEVPAALPSAVVEGVVTALTRSPYVVARDGQGTPRHST